jgi:predicted nucleic acid-binding protein
VITAVDSNVLIDVLAPDPDHGPLSRDALKRCLAEGDLVVCDVVWAETAAMFPSHKDAARSLDELGVTFSAVNAVTAGVAGAAWRLYRDRRGARVRLVTDFLVGAHAQEHADRLLTRDRGFYRSYFTRLTVLDPSQP